VEDRQQPTGCRLLGGDDDGVGLASRKKVTALYIHHVSHMLSEVFGKFQYDKNRIWPTRHPHLILI
jgi:hypothetical protein